MSGVAPDEGAAASADQEGAGQRVDGELRAADGGMSEAEGKVGYFAEGEVGGLSGGKDERPDVDAGLGEEKAKTDKKKRSRKTKKDASRRRKSARVPGEVRGRVSHKGGGTERVKHENDGSTRNGKRRSRKSTSSSSSKKARKLESTSIKKGRKLGAPPLPMQQALLMIVVLMGLLLVSELRRGLSPPKRLPPEGLTPPPEALPPKPAEPAGPPELPKFVEPVEPPVPEIKTPPWTLAVKYNAQGIENQRSALVSNLKELRQAWDSASEEIKRSFAAKLETGEEGSPGAQPDDQSPPEFEIALSALLVPAALAQETPTPASVEEKIEFGRTLALLGASVNAAQVKLKLLTELDKREKEGWAAPHLSKIKTPSKVSAEVFLRMLGDVESKEVEGDQASKTPALSRTHAEDLVRLVITNRLQVEAAEKMNDGFDSFWKDRESLRHPKDFIIPGGGTFLDKNLLLLMNQHKTVNSSIAVFLDTKVKELVKAFTRENADDAAKEIRGFVKVRTSSLSKAFNHALKGAKQNEAGTFHFALLRLLE